MNQKSAKIPHLANQKESQSRKKGFWRIFRESWQQSRQDKGARIASGENSEEMAGFRPLSGDSLRPLAPMARKKMRELAVYLWRTNPLANRLIELPIAYLLAEGAKITCPDRTAQGWLDRFWHDPINHMDAKLPKKMRELALYGEQCWPVFVNEIDGFLRLGVLDPARIEKLVCDPDNIEQPIGVVTGKDGQGKKHRYRIIVNGPETIFSARAQKMRQEFQTGECFYFALNTLTGAPRGHSDLLSQLDWLDAYDHALFGEIERWDFLRAFIYDVTLQGANAREIAEYARNISPPKPGSIRVHNEAEQWQAVTPRLDGRESADSARLFRNHIMGGATIPEHWFGGGGDVNRATAGEMGEPAFKVFSMRQRKWKMILETLSDYQIRRKLCTLHGPQGGQLAEAAQYKCTAEFPEMALRDSTSHAEAFGHIVNAVSTGKEKGLMSDQTCLRLIASVAERFGLTLDLHAELAALADKSIKQ